MLTVSWWRERLYPRREQREPFLAFLRVLGPYITPDARVLDIGAGAGACNPYSFRERCREMAGVDLDERVRTNPLLDQGVVGDASKLPFPDASFDVVFAVYVLEHIAEPAAFAREVNRVLKPGGVFAALTPNRLHYVPLIASATPAAFHRWFNARRGRAGEDTFPTYYRMNSRRALRRVFGAAGFGIEQLRCLEVQPNYLAFSLPTFLAGAAYERLVNSCSCFAGLRVNVIGVFRKQGRVP